MKVRHLLPLLVWLATGPGAGASESPLDAAVRSLQAGRLEAAERELRAFLEQDGLEDGRARNDHPGARDLLGIVLSRQQRFEEAEREFRKALDADPGFLAARQHLARLLLVSKRDREALTELRRAAELGPLERDLATRLALAETEAGRTAAAERQWRDLAERFGSVQARLRLAALRTRQREPEAARTILREALELAPNSEDVLRAYGQAAFAAGDYVTTIVALEPLIRMHPEVVEYSYLEGVARMQVGDTAGAIDALRRARRLEPRRPVTLIALGMALNLQKLFAEARDALQVSLHLEPGNVEALAALAEAEEGLAELEAAEEHATQALRREPSHALAQLVLGTVRMKQGRYEEARDAFLAAVASDPDSLKANYQLSLAYARLGDRESSRRHLEIYQTALRELEAQRRALAPAGGGM